MLEQLERRKGDDCSSGEVGLRPATEQAKRSYPIGNVESDFCRIGPQEMGYHIVLQIVLFNYMDAILSTQVPEDDVGQANARVACCSAHGRAPGRTSVNAMPPRWRKETCIFRSAQYARNASERLTTPSTPMHPRRRSIPSPRLWAFALACLAPASTARAQLRPDSATILISLLERPIGTEHYTLRTATTGLRLSSSVRLVERGTPLELDATLDLRGDLSPTHFRAKGKSYRFVNVDAEVDVVGDTARAHDLGVTDVVRQPSLFFTAQGWPPLAARALLVRYWERHGRPRTLRLLPGDAERVARIAFRGVDTVRTNNRVVPLRRYAVDGVVWGRETLWLDDHDHFAAIVTRVHILPLEGIRSDLKVALPALQLSAIADRMADLRQLALDVPPIAAGVFALTGATVIDGTGRAAMVDATILVRDGRIDRVGARAEVPIPPGERTIDARGKTIIPGLWDMHAHASQIEWASAYLAAGVTSIRDMGGEEKFLLALRETIERRGGVGPRLFLAGLVDGDEEGSFGTVTAATPDEGRAVVDHYRAARFDQIKLYSVLRPDVVAAIVARAHDVGLTVTGHVPRSLGIGRSIEAGMDQIAHLPVDGDTTAPEVRHVIDLLARGKVVVDPTIPWNELLGRSGAVPIERFEPGILRAPPALAFNYRSVVNAVDPDAAAASFQRQLAIVRAMHNAGVPLVAGTDGGVPGYSLLRSVELFVQAGFTPMEAILSATLVAARAMGRDADSGTIEAGKRADLVVLDANPLDDIANIRATRWVVSNGRLFDSAALRRAAGFR